MSSFFTKQFCLRFIHLSRINNQKCVLLSNTIHSSCMRTFSCSKSLYNDDDDDKVEKRRDISGLKPYLANRMEHRLKLNDKARNIVFKNRKLQIKFHRRLYAKYGKTSGINPGIMWPSIEENEEIIATEKQFEQPLTEMIQQLKETKEMEEIERLEKDKNIEGQMQNMPELVQKFREKLIRVGELKKEKRSNKNSLELEAEEFYGFPVQFSDPRFRQFADVKREERKMERKKMKKIQKQQLQEKKSEAEGKTEAVSVGVKS